MNDLNSIYLIGRIATTPRFYTTLTTFTIAHNSYRYINGEYLQTSCHFNISYTNNAQLSKLKKGTRIGINGKLGVKNKKIVIYATTFQLLPTQPDTIVPEKKPRPKRKKDKFQAMFNDIEET